ncbi:MAG: prephenate dehydratase domain-containing protein [Bacteroidota bacterium]
MSKDLSQIEQQIESLLKKRQQILGKEFPKISLQELDKLLGKGSSPNNRIGFLGPNASFTHEAALEYFGKSNEYFAISSIKSVFESFHSKKIRYGIVPIENNQQGNVHETIFCLAEYDCFITGEVALPIHFMLASHSKDLDQIEIIYSKDIAFRQCSKFIKASFPGKSIKLEPVESTSKAVILAKDDDTSAAICSSIATELYNLPILFENVEDATDNFTRFLIISPERNTQAQEESKSTILAKIKDGPGDLVKFLNDFYEAGINLKKIESLPARKGKNFKYWFFIDFEGNESDENIQEILEKHKSDLKFLGSYEKKC